MPNGNNGTAESIFHWSYVGGMYIGTLYVPTHAGFSGFITIVTRIYIFLKSKTCISDTDYETYRIMSVHIIGSIEQ